MPLKVVILCEILDTAASLMLVRSMGITARLGRAGLRLPIRPERRGLNPRGAAPGRIEGATFARLRVLRGRDQLMARALVPRLCIT